MTNFFEHLTNIATAIIPVIGIFVATIMLYGSNWNTFIWIGWLWGITLVLSVIAGFALVFLERVFWEFY